MFCVLIIYIFMFKSVFVRIILQVHLRKGRGGKAAASFRKRGEGGTGKFCSLAAQTYQDPQISC